MSIANAIITGSYAYGTPTEKSDIDIAVLMTPQEVEKLAAICRELKLRVNVLESTEADSPSQTSEHSVSIRFGSINIIACSRDESFKLWQDGTQILTAAKPVTRDHAMTVFARLRLERGL